MKKNNTIETERERLTQTKMIKWLNRNSSITEMVTVYSSEYADTHSHGIYCALVPASKIETILKTISWDLYHGQGMPGAVEYHTGNDTRIEYLRFGDDDGIEPLVIDREFHGMRDDYKEICEEFRLFHNLYHDRKQDCYLKFDDSGNEHLVVIVEPKRIQIRLKEIREFLAIKEMFLSLQFDYREFSLNTLDELGLKSENVETCDTHFCCGLSSGNSSSLTTYKAFSRLLGKRLIPPLPKEKSGIWGFAEKEPKNYVDFIIGVNDNGDQIIHTSNPTVLADSFGANPGSPNYLTPVQFRKQVLEKYYQQLNKYTVESGILRCGSLWSMSIDNHFDDRVVAWLGDLGRDLPYRDQLHWRSYNIPPVGGVSEIYFRRQILAQFADSNQPDHEFRQLYDNLQQASTELLGWPILLPLSAKDIYCLRAIRIPSNDEQKDFDDLVLALTKLLVDSLNEKELSNIISSFEKNETKGSISRLERVFQLCNFSGLDEHIQFLRNLQALRSSGTAHRKGSDYKKIAQTFNIDNQSLIAVFKGILIRAIHFLEFLDSAVRSKRFVLNRTDLA